MHDEPASPPSHSLGRTDLTLMVVSFVIGMGIFRTPVNAAMSAGTPWIFFAAWIVGGFVAVCGALTYAEIGSRLPVMGGYYRVFAQAYHPSIGFAVNGITVISNAASGAGVALIGAEYAMTAFAPDLATSAVAKSTFAIVCILLFYGLNLFGLRVSARTQSVLMVVKIGLVLLVISAAIVAPQAPVLALTNAPTSVMGIAQAFGLALIAVSFTYGGYQQTINFGGDVRDVSRTMPRAIVPAIAIIVTLYLCVNMAYVYVIGFEQLKTSHSIAAIMAGVVLGDAGTHVISALLFLAVLVYINAILLSNPRVMAAMSEDGSLPRLFARRSQRTGVHTVSLTVFMILSVATFSMMSTFDAILNYSIFMDTIGIATSAATIFVLRARGVGNDIPNGYRMKLYPFMPLVLIASCTFVALNIFISDPDAALKGVGIGLALLIGYLIVQRRRQSQGGES
ncbi:MAG: amino acid permease [Bacteroidetes bacterium]|nr:amino acid permease [Bacteroidota bacterium]